MGKRKGGGGGGGGGFHKGRGEDITSARGSACVIATCNVAREREGSRELVTLLTQMIEKLYPVEEVEAEEEDDKEEGREMSTEDLMRQEIEGLKAKGSTTQAVVSLQTGVKGVVFVKIRKRHICPVNLVRALFAQVAESKLPLSRHLVRVVPLQRVFFPDEQELTSHIRALIGLPAVAKEVKNEEGDEVKCGKQTEEEDEERATKRSRVDGNGEDKKTEETEDVKAKDDTIMGSFTEDKIEEVKNTSTANDVDEEHQAATPAPTSCTGIVAPALVGPALTYNLLIKIRNHDTLKKSTITHCVTSTLPRHRYHYNYKIFKGMFVVNIFKNIAGISLVEDYDNMLDFNISKHQDKHCASAPAETKILNCVSATSEAKTDELL